MLKLFKLSCERPLIHLTVCTFVENSYILIFFQISESMGCWVHTWISNHKLCCFLITSCGNFIISISCTDVACLVSKREVQVSNPEDSMVSEIHNIVLAPFFAYLKMHICVWRIQCSHSGFFLNNIVKYILKAFTDKKEK